MISYGVQRRQARLARRVAASVLALLPLAVAAAQAPASAPAAGELEALKRRYATVRAIRAPALRSRELVKIAEAVAALPTTDDAEQLDRRLSLRIDALAHADRGAEAAQVLAARLAAWRAHAPGHVVAERALEAFRAALANDLLDVAAAYCDAIEQADPTDAGVFRSTLARGRLIAARDGDAACAAYFLRIVEHADSHPQELVHEAHYQAADALFRARQLERAFAALDAMERDYAGTPAEERARHTRRGWQALLDAEKKPPAGETTRRSEELP